jgi:hypothetical protein
MNSVARAQKRYEEAAAAAAAYRRQPKWEIDSWQLQELEAAVVEAREQLDAAAGRSVGDLVETDMGMARVVRGDANGLTLQLASGPRIRRGRGEVTAAVTESAITANERDILERLDVKRMEEEAQPENRRGWSAYSRWTAPKSLGATATSHHKQTLRRMVDKGLLERRNRNASGERASFEYSISDAGRAAVWPLRLAELLRLELQVDGLVEWKCGHSSARGVIRAIDPEHGLVAFTVPGDTGYYRTAPRDVTASTYYIRAAELPALIEEPAA